MFQFLSKRRAFLDDTRKGDLAAVKHALEKGIDPNIKGKNGATALVEAAWSGHAEIVQILIEVGADVNLARDDGATALECTLQVSAQDQERKSGKR